MSDASLRITEIFYSLQGEGRYTGLGTAFVRLTGCPLRCTYCDSEYAFHGGEKMAIDAIVAEVEASGARYVCVTGGEPLAQPNCLVLLKTLCDLGYQVSLETSGALDVSAVDTRVSKVLDLKTPASGELSRNLYENLDYLAAHDQVKFVICNRQDYEWARLKIDEHDLCGKVDDVLFSPSFGEINALELAEWILADKLNVRFQLQMHKLLWNDAPGH